MNPDSVPPSSGKTVVIGGSVAIACQKILQVVGHDVWGLPWMTPDIAGDIMIVAVALAGWLMHSDQRRKERKFDATQTGAAS
jgi:hypothetical protein